MRAPLPMLKGIVFSPIRHGCIVYVTRFCVCACLRKREGFGMNFGGVRVLAVILAQIKLFVCILLYSSKSPNSNREKTLGFLANPVPLGETLFSSDLARLLVRDPACNPAPPPLASSPSPSLSPLAFHTPLMLHFLRRGEASRG